jgi:hypothetical protein
MSDDPIEFECPRCARSSRARFYGPCPTCREELASKFLREGRQVEVAIYEPKMNVVPNQVATKE